MNVTIQPLGFDHQRAHGRLDRLAHYRQRAIFRPRGLADSLRT